MSKFCILILALAQLAVANPADGNLSLMSASEYAKLDQAAQQAYTKGLADVVVALEELGGPTKIEASKEVPISRGREPASASGIEVRVGSNKVTCAPADPVCIFAGHSTCRKGGLCRMPMAAECSGGVRCHPVFGVGGDSKGFCVTREETSGYQNVSKYCLKKRDQIGAHAAAMYAADYERFEADTWKLWHQACWDKEKTMARPNRDKSACEAISIAAHKARNHALQARKIERESQKLKESGPLGVPEEN